MNIWDFIIGAAVIIVVITAASGVLKSRKSGKCSCGSCSGCLKDCRKKQDNRSGGNYE